MLSLVTLVGFRKTVSHLWNYGYVYPGRKIASRLRLEYLLRFP